MAWIRFLALCPMAINDILEYFNIVLLSYKPANLLTITFDLFFLLSGTIILIFLLFDKFHKNLTYFINLLRYSKRATVYSGFLSIIVFWVCTLNFNAHYQSDIIPMFIAMLIMIVIGYSITSSNKDMMLEANIKN